MSRTVTVQTSESGADARIGELRAAIAAIWSDREDPGVNSEVVVLLSELRRAEQRLGVRP